MGLYVSGNFLRGRRVLEQLLFWYHAVDYFRQHAITMQCATFSPATYNLTIGWHFINNLEVLSSY